MGTKHHFLMNTFHNYFYYMLVYKYNNMKNRCRLNLTAVRRQIKLKFLEKKILHSHIQNVT